MSLLGQIGAMLGGAGAGGEQGGGGVQEALSGLIASQGGVQGLAQKFESGGMGNVFSSWVSNGENQPVAPDALHGLLGPEAVQALTEKTGLPVATLLPMLAQYLPQIINSVTPQGQLPAAGQEGDMLGNAFGALLGGNTPA